MPLARRAKSAGSYVIEVRAAEDQPARKATVQFSFQPVRLIPPKHQRGNHSRELLCVWAMRVWESNLPRGATPLEWFLLTNEPVENAETARQAIGWLFNPRC